jgi:hypothetical protein
VEERTIDSYFFFGTAVRFAQDAVAGWLISGTPGKILPNLDQIFGYIELLSLTVTSRLPAVASLDELRSELRSRPAGGELTTSDADQIQDLMAQIRPTLLAELGTSAAFIVTDKRWDTAKLLHDVGALFRPTVFDVLPDVARIDFQEAGKCIAFERPTAAAFHILRGTEAVLRDYYCSVVKQKRLVASQRNWGPMVAQMRARRKPPPSPLLDNLDSIRVNYRNPTQHPELTYDVHDAQDLFGLCSDAVNQMVLAMA